MDARPLMQFFEPLYKYLETENIKAGSFAGWTKGELVLS